MKLLISILFFSTCTLTYSQSFTNPSNGPQGAGVIYNTMNTKEKIIVGSPNFNDNWQTGVIKMSNGNIFELDFIQYNIYLKKVLYKIEDITYYLPLNSQIEEIQIGNEAFEYSLYKDNSSRDFYQVLSKGSEASLLKHYKCQLIKGRGETGMLPATDDKYSVSSGYYLKVHNQKPKKIKIKKNEVLQVLNDQSDEIASYLKTNKIRLKNESELIQVVKFYNGLN